MAKSSMIEREKKRARLAEKFGPRREELKKIIKNVQLPAEQRKAAILELQKQPRDASICRRQNRCAMTGRPHAVYRRFKLSRNTLRRAAMNGYVPGLQKASW